MVGLSFSSLRNIYNPPVSHAEGAMFLFYVHYRTIYRPALKSRPILDASGSPSPRNFKDRADVLL